MFMYLPVPAQVHFPASPNSVPEVQYPTKVLAKSQVRSFTLLLTKLHIFIIILVFKLFHMHKTKAYTLSA